VIQSNTSCLELNCFDAFSTDWESGTAIVVGGNVCHHAPLGSNMTRRAINQTRRSSILQKTTLLVIQILLRQR
jgi:hypothetical protein